MEKTKCFQVRLPKDMWVFLKKMSIDQEIPMNEIIVRLISRHKEKKIKKIKKI